MKAAITIALAGCVCLAAWLCFGGNGLDRVDREPASKAAAFPRATAEPKPLPPVSNAASESMPAVPNTIPPQNPIAPEIGPLNLFYGELVALDRVRNQGRAAAPEAFETLLWALKGGKNEVVADLMGDWMRQSEGVNRQRVQNRIDWGRFF